MANLPGISAYFDNILIQGKTMEECEDWLRKVLKRLKENNLHINEKKCKFSIEEREYLGHVIWERGLQKSETKIKTIEGPF